MKKEIEGARSGERVITEEERLERWRSWLIVPEVAQRLEAVGKLDDEDRRYIQAHKNIEIWREGPEELRQSGDELLPRRLKVAVAMSAIGIEASDNESRVIAPEGVADALQVEGAKPVNGTERPRMESIPMAGIVERISQERESDSNIDLTEAIRELVMLALKDNSVEDWENFNYAINMRHGGSVLAKDMLKY